MPRRIESITMESFKGATCNTSIDFDSSKPVVLIFGENGTGKSTIVDGIDFVCNESFGSLNDRSVSGSKADLVTSIGNSLDNLKVSLKYGRNVWTSAIGHGKKPSRSGSGQSPSVYILRRSQILDIVNSEPKNRYEALKNFIAVPNTENNENTLRNAVRSVQSDFDESARSYTQANEQLEKLWKLEGSPDRSHIVWGKSKSSVDVSSLQNSVSTLKDAIDKMKDCKTNNSQLSLADSQFKETEEEFSLAKENCDSVKSKIEGHEKDIIDVLEEAKKFIEKYPDIENCPVCEQTVTIDNLKNRIDKRITNLNDLVKAKKSFEDAKKLLGGKELILNSKKKDWIISIRNLASYVKDAKIPEIDVLGISWTDYSELLDSEDTDEIVKFISNASQLSQKFLPYKGTLEARYGNEQKELNQLNAIKTSYQTIVEKTKKARKLETQLKTLTEIHKLVESKRKEYVENELSSISGEVDALYSKIHPDEGLGKVKLYLKAKAIGSLEFTGKFQDASDIQPQAYYSESHLDTLGVCIFLALSKKYTDEDTVVILDDVITSTDDVHLTRFMNLLHDETLNFNQLIITTHYRPWRDRYKYGGGPTSNIQLIELLHWSHPRGIMHTKTKLSVEELGEYLEDGKFDRQVVASKAGILLEGLTDHIALCYGCRLPRKAEPNYTLGELMDAISSKLKKVLKVEKISNGSSSLLELAPLLDEISPMTWMRNQVGCHFNISGMGVSDSDVRSFGEKTINLANSMICDTCGELPHRKKSGSYWDCKCDATKMHPLTMPS